MQQSVAEETREQRHAAQKNSKRHLVIAIDNLRGLPSAPARCLRIRKPLHEAMRALHPDHENRAESKQRSGERSGKNREDGQLHAKERAHHRHELDVAKAHAFGAAPSQINCRRSVNERCPQARAQQGIEQGPEPIGDVAAEWADSPMPGRNCVARSFTGTSRLKISPSASPVQRQLVGQQLGFGVGENQTEQQE